MPEKYRIHLTEAERTELKALAAAGKAFAPKRLRAQIPLAAAEDYPDGAMKDEDGVRRPAVSVRTVERIRRALARARPANHRARPAAAAQNQPPQNRLPDRSPPGGRRLQNCARRPLPLDSQTSGRPSGALSLVESISPQTIGGVLQKRVETLASPAVASPPAGQCGLCPRHGGCAGSPCATAESAAPSGVSGWILQTAYRRGGGVLPSQPGKPDRQDSEHVGYGLCGVFMAYSPLETWHEAGVTGQNAARDYAQTIRWLCD